MDPTRYQRLKELFRQAVELDSAKRGPFLDQECGDDPELRAKVDELLVSDGEQRGPIAGVLTDPGSDFDPASMPQDGAPEQIGPYRVVGVLGQGGMGTVYLAEQEEPIRRRVALKVTKGLDTNSVLARFDVERRALAMMSHDGIARVFDAGTTPAGQPYFVMEYVPGSPITEYCDDHQLSVHERIDLFQRVCAGVQHAHQKGVIHRDLKPSNILVADEGGRAVPKIIDFGLARAVDEGRAEWSMRTQQGEMLGTPGYMSPEQADPEAGDVDTRSDVYALGLLLYELLTGQLPFSDRAIRLADWSKLQRQLREDEPPRPSTRLMEAGDDASATAIRRHTTTHGLARQLRGDLDWIVLKALAPQPDRRYETPNEIAADLRRFQRHEAVEAGPPSTVYRLRKFARRYRAQVTIAATAVVLLIGFAVAMALQADATARERDRANLEADSLRRVTDFLVDMYQVSRPGEALGETMTVRAFLDRGARSLSFSLRDQPRLRARLATIIGRVYRDLGLYPESERLLDQALDLRLEVHGAEHAEVAESLNHLALLDMTRGKHERAEARIERAERIAVSVAGPDSLERATVMSNRGSLLIGRGRFQDARPIYEGALAIRRRVLGDGHLDVAGSLVQVGDICRMLGDFAAAEPCYEEAQAIYEARLGPVHPKLAQLLATSGILRAMQRRHEDAEPLFRRALEVRQKVLEPGHPDIAQSTVHLALNLVEQDRLGDAESLYLSALDVYERAFGENHEDVTIVLNNLGTLYQKMGQRERALDFHERVLRIRRELFDAGHPLIGTSLNNLGKALCMLERFEEAESYLLESKEIKDGAYPEGHPKQISVHDNLGDLYLGWGRPAEAVPFYERALQLKEKNHGGEHPRLARTLFQMGCATAVQGLKTKALGHLRRAIELGYSTDRAQSEVRLKSLRDDPRFRELIDSSR